jgi:hypothetical protein
VQPRRGAFGRRSSYAALCIFATAFGWTEASTVVYLRALTPLPPRLAAVQIPQVLLTSFLSGELVREACTMLLLASVSWLAARRLRDFAGAFLLTFGLWDLVYYGVLRLLVGWPETLSSRDILFLIPVPWVGPVWAPMTGAAIFVAAGTFLFQTPDRDVRYSVTDAAILLISATAVVASFLVPWDSATAQQYVPDAFRPWLYWAGLLAGAAWFIRVDVTCRS